MTEASVAVIKSDFHGHHTSSWSDEWLKICNKLRISHELIDWRANGAFERLSKHDVVLWHFSHYSDDEMKFAPSILTALKNSGCAVFPDEADSRHFDDKIVQSYFLRSLKLPTPKNYPLHSFAAVEDWIRDVGKFPVVGKLRAGSGASNVTLLANEEQLRRYAGRMFGRGFSSKPSVLFKIKSNAKSSKSLEEALTRIKRAPEFLFSRRQAASRARERGYVYLQEFVQGVDYDLKVVVVGDKLSFIGRGVRKGDFRASGGGDLFYDHNLITPELIETAFEAANLLGSDCTGFDMICDPGTAQPLILEMSYGFSHTALLEAGGYYDRQGNWYRTPLNAPEAVLLRMLDKVSSK